MIKTNKYEMLPLMKETLEQAIDWLKDCYWEDMEPEDFDDLSEAEIWKAIDRFYGGGLEAFVVDCTEFPEPILESLFRTASEPACLAATSQEVACTR